MVVNAAPWGWRRAAAGLCLALLLGACGESDVGARSATGDAGRSAASPAAPAPPAGPPRVEEVGPAGLRPVVFADTGTLWGIMGGRLTRLDVGAGRAEREAHNAWSVAGGPGVVSWRNETGTWGKRGADFHRRLAPTVLMPGYEGPPDALWSPSGERAVLSWAAEWDEHHELIDTAGRRRTLASFVEGYMADHATLWLDEQRVLFTIVAKASREGDEAYRESGWRRDLAVLDLAADTFTRVTDVPDGVFLQPAGLYQGRLLVTEFEAGGVRAHWLYDPTDWSRASLELPPGRSFAAGDAIVSYVPQDGSAEQERWSVRLITPADTTELGLAADPDLPPAMTRDGRRIALRLLRNGRPALVVIRR